MGEQADGVKQLVEEPHELKDERAELGNVLEDVGQEGGKMGGQANESTSPSSQSVEGTRGTPGPVTERKRALGQGDIPRLPGWLTVPESAERLGVTPNRMNQLIHKDRFVAGEDLFRIGSAALVIKEEAVKRYKRARDRAKRR